jgi:hypothetical protein
VGPAPSLFVASTLALWLSTSHAVTSRCPPPAAHIRAVEPYLSTVAGHQLPSATRAANALRSPHMARRSPVPATGTPFFTCSTGGAVTLLMRARTPRLCFFFASRASCFWRFLACSAISLSAAAARERWAAPAACEEGDMPSE